MVALVGLSGTARTNGRFAAGQRWAYQTRAGEESSTLTILKVEDLPKLGPIVHIAVDGLKLKTTGGVQTRIGHMPFSRAALDGSVTRLLAEKVALPDFAEGYSSWKEAHGGVFTISVAAAIDSVATAAR